MVLFIRDELNNTIVDLELYKNKYIECSVAIDIYYYSNKLLELVNSTGKLAIEFIKDIDYISEIKEKVHNEKRSDTDEEIQRIKTMITNLFLTVCEKYDLLYVED